ncbi:hypothetical protein QYF36_011126 [Acer negundo]|nr:hypothetical protein QYF36_011126 [Acer negundo]
MVDGNSGYLKPNRVDVVVVRSSSCDRRRLASVDSCCCFHQVVAVLPLSSGRAADSVASSCDRIGVSEAKCCCRAVVVVWLQSIQVATSIKSSSCIRRVVVFVVR